MSLARDAKPIALRPMVLPGNCLDGMEEIGSGIFNGRRNGCEGSRARRLPPTAGEDRVIFLLLLVARLQLRQKHGGPS